MKKIIFLILFFSSYNLLEARCSDGFISLKGRIINKNGKPLKDVIGFGFINNYDDIYYDQLWFKAYPNETHIVIYKEDAYFKSREDGNIEIKLYFYNWSKEEEIMEPHCEERIRRVDLIFFKEGYLPLRKVILPIRDNILIDYNKPFSKIIINIGEIKMKKIMSDEEKEEFIRNMKVKKISFWKRMLLKWKEIKKKF